MKFQPEQFFDLSEWEHRDIFNGVENAWEVLPKIEQYIKTNKVIIGRGTKIEKYAVIGGPAIIGKNCFIGHAAYLRGHCILGDNVVIGHAVEIKNSIILNNSSIAHLNYVGDSIIGSHVNFSGGAIAANFRFDGKEVTVKMGSKKIPTGLTKFGAVVGDHSQIGVNAVLNPGTILGKNTLVYPAAVVFGSHKDNEKIKK